MVKFGRLLTAMVTPFNEKLEVDYQAAQELAVRLVQTGSDGVVVAGTTGESPTLSREEKVNLFKAVVEAIGGQATVIAGTGSYDTYESIELTKAAEKTGVDGIMLVSPYYSKPSQEGLYRHFRAVANATTLPIIIYNIPGRTAVNVNVDTLLKLAGVENIVAVKEASGNLGQISEIHEKAPADFVIYSGDDLLTLPIMSVGGYGIISVAGHIVGRKIKEMVNAFSHGEIEQAIASNASIGPLIRALFVNTNPIMVKAACNLLGMKVGGLRLPLVEANENELKLLRDELKKLGLI